MLDIRRDAGIPTNKNVWCVISESRGQEDKHNEAEQGVPG